MHIKQVIIQGFRSYRDHTVVEIFSPHLNVIVGRNGSGKSNFFHAIQFVLSDEFTHLRTEERLALIHEGAGTKALSAYVEIVFDNTDGRIPIEKTEIAVRRMISGKKDQYFLDKKIVNKGDIMNLLEGAGFSRSNPYYIVKQGKITQLAVAPDSSRLQLLREVAGTRVYDEKKDESQKILEETEEKRAKVEELLAAINDRLQSLETEKEELRQYQKWDKAKRALEFTLLDQEMADISKKIDQIQEKRDNSGVRASELESQLTTIIDKIKDLTSAVNEVKTQLASLLDEKEQIAVEVKEKYKQRAKLENEIKDITDEDSGIIKRKEVNQKALEKVLRDIEKAESRLTVIIPQYEALKTEEIKKSTERELAESTRKDIFAKYGRQNQFSSKEERDKWLQNEIKSLKRSIRDSQERINLLRKEIKTDSDQREELQNKIQEIKGRTEEQNDLIKDGSRIFDTLRISKDEIANKRNDLWRSESSRQQALDVVKDELQKVDSSLRSLTGKGALQGIDSIQNLLKEFKEKNINLDIVKGYRGTLIENFTCNKAFYTAVEVAAGSRLFYHIFDNDRLATRLVREFNKRGMRGEVNFLPLNVLHVPSSDFVETPNAFPMVSKLEYNNSVAKAIRHVFGKCVICRSLEIASSIARSENFDCITLDGDQVSRRGALTGGFIDNRTSRMELRQLQKTLQSKAEALISEINELREQNHNLEGQLTSVVAELHKHETKIRKNRDTLEQMRSDVRHMTDEISRIETNQYEKETQIHGLETRNEQFKSKLESLENELGTELLTNISTQQETFVSELNETIKRLNTQIRQICDDRVKLETEKTKLEFMLNNNFKKKRDQLMHELGDSLNETSVGEKLSSLQTQLKSVSEWLTKHESNIDDIDSKIMEFNRALKGKQKELDNMKAMEKKVSDEISEDVKALAKISSRQQILQQKREEYCKKIRDLGSLPQDAYDKYRKLPSKELYRKIEEANMELKKYSHVNKKALDQFIQFSEEREKLTSRKEELDKDEASIKELMMSLDEKKFETIQLTFKQVSTHFAEVFKTLIPSGVGTLLMKRSNTDSADNMTQSDSFSGSARFEDFHGIGIRVSFSGAENEMKDMQQLSGGQKTLVALALIFAIQKSDPAPFYLFDEVDQALDAKHRRSVASMIRQLTSKAQFIATTFRSEMLEYADSFYGVTFKNKVSHIRSVTKEEAAEFIQVDEVQK